MWLQVDTTLPRHPKLARLARRLDIPKAQALGHLVSLWLWCLDYAPDGDLASFDSEEVAEAGLWEGDPTTFLDALAAAGFLEREGDALSIHDWYEYGGKALAALEANRERQKRHRERQKTSGRNGYVTVTSPLRNALDKIRKEEIREEEIREDGSPCSGAFSGAYAGGTGRALECFPPETAVLLRRVKAIPEGPGALGQHADFVAQHYVDLQSTVSVWQTLSEAERSDLFEADCDLWRLAYDADRLQQAVAAWEGATGRRATPNEVRYLSHLEQSGGGEDLLAAAIREAAASTDHINLSYVQAIYKRRCGIEWDPTTFIQSDNGRELRKEVE